MIEINRNPDRKTVRQFALIWIAVFGVLGAAYVYRWGQPWTAMVLSVVSALGGPAYFIPSFGRLLYVGACYAAFPIGFVVSHVILAVVFYLVVTPIGLIMRLAGRDPMHRAFVRDAKTYWVPRERTTDPARYFRQF
jgi:hypothetical protein